MTISRNKRKIRLPLQIPIGIETGWVEALVIGGVLAVHPSLNHPGAGVWTVTLAGCGQGIVHLPSEREAEAFAVELYRTCTAAGVSLDYAHHSQVPSDVVLAIKHFIERWGTLRYKVLPKRAAERTVPAGIAVPGWDRLRSPYPAGTLLDYAGNPVRGSGSKR